MNHGGPVAGDLNHRALTVQAGEGGLLREEHPGGGQLQARQDLLPEGGQVWGLHTGRGRRGSRLGCGCRDRRGCRNGCRVRCRNGRDRCCRSGRSCTDGRGRSLGRGWGGRAGLDGRFSQQAEQEHFEPEAGLNALAQLLLASLELGLPAQQLRFADAAGEGRQLAADLRREAGELQAVRGDAGEYEVPQQARHSLEDGAGLAAALEQVADRFDDPERLAPGQGLGELQQFLLGHGPQQFPDRHGFDGARQQAELIEEALGIPQAPLGPLGDHMQGFGGDLDRLLLSDPAQVLLEGIQGNAPVVEALTTAQDRGQNPLRVGGGQHKDHPRRRLLQGFEQGVEGRGREHVALVHHVDLPAGLNRGEA